MNEWQKVSIWPHEGTSKPGKVVDLEKNKTDPKERAVKFIS